MANIIHNPRELMNLDRDSLDEILLEDYKNIALLRELLRVTLLQLKTQTELCNIHRDRRDKALDRLDNIKHDIDELIDKYRCE